MRAAFVVVLAACWGCGADGSLAPSIQPLGGNYTMALTRCGLEGEAPEVTMVFACADQNLWRFSLEGEKVAGRADGGHCAPFVWSGTLIGTIAGSVIEIASITYRDSSSHTQIQTLSLSGRAVVDKAGFAGTVSGDYTAMPVFASFSGPLRACHGAQMPFRFSRAR